MLSNCLSLGLLAAAGTALAQTPPYFTPSTDVNLPATFDVNSTNPDFFVVGGVFSVNGMPESNNTTSIPKPQFPSQPPLLSAARAPPANLPSRPPATQSAPQLYLPSNSTFTTTSNTSAANPATFLILMLDPDAPSPQDTSRAAILHWLQPGVRLSRSVEPFTSANGTVLTLLSERDTATAALAPYIGPAPPSAAPHRYIVTLWRQPEAEFVMPSGFEGYVGGEERTGFNVSAFVEGAGLRDLVAATYFLAGNGTGGDGSETYEGDDAAAGIGGNTSVPDSASSASGTASASGGGSGAATPTAADAASATESASGAERLGVCTLVVGVVGAMAVLG
ncbi:Carboxypeptidase Y inhibitor [Diplodia seriata]|uniref:Carboxypeptidase Y inhibitor n=1 Tax=Diplodia seriata TaxID=420778 RepID=A0A1S8B5R9_9PEZI|nr:Carboxypeptidase Y inhibitor [Diplodia seriata]